MRILALHLTSPSSSEAKVLATLLRALPAGHEVHLITNALGEADPASYFADLTSVRSDVVLHPLRLGLPLDFQVTRPLLGRVTYHIAHATRRGDVLDLARRCRPDMIYTSQQRFDCRLGELVARRLCLPQVVHLHYRVGPWLRPSTVNRLRTCDGVLAISQFIAEDARRHGVAGERVYVVPNGLKVHEPIQRSARSVQAEEQRRFRIIHVGRLVTEKGFFDSLEVVARLKNSIPGLELVLVGEGPQRAALEQRAAKLQLSGVVRFTGWRTDVDAMLRESDLFLFPSRREPFGLVLLEAGAAGMAVVAYREGGATEVVAEGETGLLVRPGDLDALVDAVLRLYRDPVKRAEMGRAGRERVERVFSHEHAANAFHRSLLAIAERRRGADRAMDRRCE